MTNEKKGATAVRERVAILGGGMAALTAAYELARLGRYDITVYTLGWRLGGKGASGRNEASHQRIEEHGLHIWFGAYRNAFAVMRDVYNDTAAKWPNGNVSAAFTPQYGFHLMEWHDDRWKPWSFPLGKRAGLPWDAAAGTAGAPADLLQEARAWLGDYHLRSLSPRLAKWGFTPWRLGGELEWSTVMAMPLLAAQPLPLDHDGRLAMARAYGAYASTLSTSIEKTWLGWDDIRRAGIIAAVVASAIAATLASNVIDAADWDAINDQDLRCWLSPYLGDLTESCLIEASYDLYFSYEKGDTSKGRIEAGTMMRAAMWLLLQFRGAFMWRMNAGMGDAIFAPLYNALSGRGVKFEFFHKVTSLQLTPDGGNVKTINMKRQAAVDTGTTGKKCYEPFVQVHGIDCWPHRPLFDQLKEGARLRADWDRVDFESDRSTESAGAVALELGQQFDKVVLGIPIAGLRSICADLVARNPAGDFVRMLDNVKTVRTCAAQLWLDRSLAQLRSQPPAFAEEPILTTFVNPLDTYADMTHLAKREDWPAGGEPAHIAYFCGVLSDDDGGAPPRDRARGYACGMLDRGGGTPAPMRWLWDKSYAGGTFDWGRLLGSGVGKDRFLSQYWRANVDMSERYVLALPDTSKYRMGADSGVANLVFAGDWTRNGLYLGCIEGAVISGKQAARALSGCPITIEGEGSLFA